MKPHLHGNSSVKKFGGKREDYQDIHDFIDQTKAHHADMRHRAILHNSFGCYLVERVFGVTRINSDGKEYSPRDIAEMHIIEDMGDIPPLTKYLQCMTLEPWMARERKKKRTMTLSEAFSGTNRTTYVD
jgi:hypothetical protein